MSCSSAEHPSSPVVSLCFVCLGNICRSPTGEGVMRRLAFEADLSLEIDSAGTAAYHAGEAADPRSRSFAESRGYELSSIARQFVIEDFLRFDYVLAMDVENLAQLQGLRDRASTVRAHLSLLRDFDPSAEPGSSVPDPYYGGDRGFLEVLNQCERACRGLIEHIRTNGRRGTS